MIHHIGVGVGDFAKSRAFYEKALAPLGYEVVMEFGQGAGFGRDGKPAFWLYGWEPAAPHLHVAFAARSRAEVDAFYAAAMAAGGRDNGAPGIVEEYRPDYYAAFVFDPDGYNIEAIILGEGSPAPGVSP
jgi:catechol 2,3-dioxygenase-like lactoylglutathione lyase family enzyme